MLFPRSIARETALGKRMIGVTLPPWLQLIEVVPEHLSLPTTG